MSAHSFKPFKRIIAYDFVRHSHTHCLARNQLKHHLSLSLFVYASMRGWFNERLLYNVQRRMQMRTILGAILGRHATGDQRCKQDFTSPVPDARAAILGFEFTAGRSLRQWRRRATDQVAKSSASGVRLWQLRSGRRATERDSGTASASD